MSKICIMFIFIWKVDISKASSVPDWSISYVMLIL